MRRHATLLALALCPLLATALELNEQQFIEYSAQQHCLNQSLWDQPEKLEDALHTLEQSFGIDEDGLEALEDLAARHNSNPAIRDAIEQRAQALCPEA